MIVSAMDMLHTSDVDAICIASSDSDFTPLAIRLRESGIEVFGAGDHSTSEGFVAACDKFINVDELVEAHALMVSKDKLPEVASKLLPSKTAENASTVNIEESAEVGGDKATETPEVSNGNFLEVRSPSSMAAASSTTKATGIIGWLTEKLSGSSAPKEAAHGASIARKKDVLGALDAMPPGYPFLGDVISVLDSLGIVHPPKYASWTAYLTSNDCHYVTCFECQQLKKTKSVLERRDMNPEETLQVVRSIAPGAPAEAFESAARDLYYYVGRGEPVRLVDLASSWGMAHGYSVKKHGFKNFKEFIKSIEAFESVNVKVKEKQRIFITWKDSKMMSHLSKLSKTPRATLFHKNA